MCIMTGEAGRAWIHDSVKHIKGIYKKMSKASLLIYDIWADLHQQNQDEKISFMIWKRATNKTIYWQYYKIIICFLICILELNVFSAWLLVSQFVLTWQNTHSIRANEMFCFMLVEIKDLIYSGCKILKCRERTLNYCPGLSMLHNKVVFFIFQL